MDLMGGNALLRGRQEEQRGKPLRERDFAALEYGLDGDGELLTALVALLQAGTVLAAFQLGHMFFGNAAMRPDRAWRPNPSFEPLTGFGLVAEDRVLKVRHGTASFLPTILPMEPALSRL